MDINAYIKAEGWFVQGIGDDRYIEVQGYKFPLNKIVHPYQVHAKLYRDISNPEIKYFHMKKMHDYLWPDAVWHSWTEDRFREHCEAWPTISYAGGANTTKSYDAAKIALLFWLADPGNRAVIVASTTLDSAGARIWGYIKNLLREVDIKLQYKILKGTAPKILYDRDDTIHGMFAIAAAKGGKDDKDGGESAIKNYIGRHPNNGLMLILDEATDLMPSILKAIPNLARKQKFFQCMVLGNSLSKFDLHGSLSTPRDGWKSVNALSSYKWETTQGGYACFSHATILQQLRNQILNIEKGFQNF